MRIICSFLPKKGKDDGRKFLSTKAGKFCLTTAELLNLPVNDSNLLTHVVSAADQRYSHRMAELNFDIYCNPATTARIGADELYEKLLREFPELATIDVQLTYLSGISHPTWNDVRRGPRV